MRHRKDYARGWDRLERNKRMTPSGGPLQPGTPFIDPHLDRRELINAWHNLLDQGPDGMGTEIYRQKREEIREGLRKCGIDLRAL